MTHNGFEAPKDVMRASATSGARLRHDLPQLLGLLDRQAVFAVVIISLRRFLGDRRWHQRSYRAFRHVHDLQMSYKIITGDAADIAAHLSESCKHDSMTTC